VPRRSMTPLASVTRMARMSSWPRAGTLLCCQLVQRDVARDVVAVAGVLDRGHDGVAEAAQGATGADRRLSRAAPVSGRAEWGARGR